MHRPTSKSPRRRLLACGTVAIAMILLTAWWYLQRAPQANAGSGQQTHIDAQVVAVAAPFGASSGLNPDAWGPPREGPPVLQIITSNLLEVTWVGKAGDPPEGSPGQSGRPVLPRIQDVTVKAGAEELRVTRVGFKRHAAHAPFKSPRLLVANSVFIELEAALHENQEVEVSIKGGSPALPGRAPGAVPRQGISASFDPARFTPVIHVNQTGYLPAEKKTAMVGYYLGTLGELSLPERSAFTVVDGAGKEAAKGSLLLRADEGFPYPAYRKVLEADFTSLREPGRYRLHVPGLGYSYPFAIGEEVAAALARTYALGLYHQRCGAANALPFTRYTHGPCHVAPAAIPDASPKHENSNWTLSTENEDAGDEPRRTAPRVTSVNQVLYPFVNKGPVDVRGGHHDAGDYSKYTINSASFIHHLVIACDAFPGVAALDNLGIPESGDGKGDLLQEAKWEADFLARMQDADGGFYFLVYPQGRRYESDVTPDKGDPQVVFPKNTAATAAAVAALAQCASSPEFKRHFPEAVGGYLEKARKGWAFLELAIARHGKDGSYQRITHYGDQFMHDDELAWAATELFLATGEATYRERMNEWFKPSDPEMRKWGWWRLFDAQGCAIRSYGLAEKTGRLTSGQLDQRLLRECQQELVAAGDDQVRRARQSAYGTSFPIETKRAFSAGWYFSPDAAFDLAVASQLNPPASRANRDYLEAILSNFNYEQGCNPVNVCYLTGLGWKRQFEIVHQYAQNDRRTLPPIGIPLGNIQEGISWIDAYKDQPGKLTYPAADDEQAPYPFYDRWSDGFNLSQEFVILNQARALGVAAWLMSQTSLKDQPYKPVAATIAGLPNRPRLNQPAKLTLSVPNLDLSEATILWETSDTLPQTGPGFEWRPAKPGPAWVEAEAQLPDGRRAFAIVETIATR